MLQRHMRLPIALTLGLMLAVTAFGLWHTGFAALSSWSPLLRGQALWILAAAAPIALVSQALPWPMRGWPFLTAILGVAAAVMFGAGAVLAVALLALVCLLLGHGIALAMGAPSADPLGATALGAGASALLLSSIGLTGVPMIPVFWGLVALAAAAGLSRISRRHLLAAAATCRPSGPAGGLLGLACRWLSLACLAFYLAQTALPERLWDAHVMHLMIANQIVTFGSWIASPADYFFAAFPIGADYLFAFAMALGGEQAAKLLNFALLVGIVLLLRDILRDVCEAWLREATTLLLLAVPVVLLCTAAAMVENLLCFLTLAAVRGVLRLRGETTRASLVALAVLLPALASVKLHGVVVAAACLGAGVAQLRGTRISARDLAAPAALGVAAGLLGVSQYLHAWHVTGNPVFPFMNHIFASPLWPVESYEDTRWQGRFTWDVLYQATFHSDRFLEAYAGALGFVFLILLPPGIVATVMVPSRTARICLGIAAVPFFALFAHLQYLRYVHLAFPLLLVVCAHGLSALGPWRLGPWGLGRGLAVLAAGAAALLGLAVLPAAAWSVRAADLRAAVDPVTRQRLLLEQASSRLATEAINGIAPGAPRVLFGSEPYGGVLRGTPIYIQLYNRDLYLGLRDAQDAAAVDRLLAPLRADFLVVPLRSQDPMDRKLLEYADRHGRFVSAIGAAGLWRLSGQP